MRVGLFPAANPKASLFLMAGRSEFMEKYFEVITDLHARGFNVVSMDWRGQGLSGRALPDPQKGHVASFDLFVDDIDLMTEELLRPRYQGPYFLMTHSMGGLPTLQMLARGDDRFKAAVLCAPMTQLFDDTAKRASVRMLCNLATTIGLGRQSIPGVKEHSLDFEGNNLTSDKARHTRFRLLQEAEPKAILREPTYGWLKAAHDAIDEIHKPDHFKGLKTPVRIISAEKDELVSSADHQWLAEQSSLIDCVTIDGALHEILMEQDHLRAAYWQAFDEFVERFL